MVTQVLSTPVFVRSAPEKVRSTKASAKNTFFFSYKNVHK